MTYANVPVIIPILATGYLLTVYLLLVLAQRHTRSSETNEISIPRMMPQQETPVTGRVNEVSS